MDKIAVISDIHGNILALSSVLKDISLRNVDRIFCLGDLVGKGPESKEAIDIVRSSCDFVLKGNWDELITREDVNDVVRWHQNQLSQEDIEYLRSLPFSIDFYMSGRRLRLFHASPFSVWIRVQPWDSIEKDCPCLKTALKPVWERRSRMLSDTVMFIMPLYSIYPVKRFLMQAVSVIRWTCPKHPTAFWKARSTRRKGLLFRFSTYVFHMILTLPFN